MTGNAFRNRGGLWKDKAWYRSVILYQVQFKCSRFYSGMSSKLSKESSIDEVASYLSDEKFDDSIIEKFKGELQK